MLSEAVIRSCFYRNTNALRFAFLRKTTENKVVTHSYTTF